MQTTSSTIWSHAFRSGRKLECLFRQLIKTRVKKPKRFWFYWVSLAGHGGSEAGASRCSVKPALRGTLLSRKPVTQSLRSSHRVQLLAWNGQASRLPARTRPANSWPMFQHLKAPTRVTSLCYKARRYEPLVLDNDLTFEVYLEAHNFVKT
ncbi:unnamed protein product [Prunus armeniaca]|uniref:Uncharacterized protein n=1 Tax=Prunus armeniaca TaxID=36596 RepID=A0A6J5X103_PRUAR|nr:unnamed protein product [Prunus armeniaca]